MNVSSAFTGSALSFGASGGGVSIDPATGELNIPTDALREGVEVTITATNSGGQVANAFRVTITAVDVGPTLLVAPSLTGAAVIGNEITADPGLWTGTPIPELGVTWLVDGVEVSDAAGLVYLPGPEDDGKTLAVRVVASNVAGTAEAVSTAMTVTHAAPVAVEPLPDASFALGSGVQSIPTASAFVGEALRFAVAGTGATIDPGTGVVTLTTESAREALVTVTATNSGGSAQASFAVTVAGAGTAAPALVSAPALLGEGLIGSSVTLDPGVWSGTPAPELTFQWRRDGADLEEATGAIYLPEPADDGATLSCCIVATNPAGAASAVTEELNVTYATPMRVGTLPEEVFDQGTGSQQVPTAAVFTGEGLRFAVKGAGATIDPKTGVVSVPTDAAVSGETVTVTATNSGGSASASFLVTVEGAEAAAAAEAASETQTGYPATVMDQNTYRLVLDRIAAGKEPQKTAYANLLSDCAGYMDFEPAPPASMSITQATTGSSRDKLGASSRRAYALALSWALGGNTKHAAKARDILMAWANKGTTFHPGGSLANKASGGLHVGVHFCGMSYAFDLLRTYSGFTDANQTTYKNWWNGPNGARALFLAIMQDRDLPGVGGPYNAPSRTGDNWIEAGMLGLGAAAYAFEDEKYKQHVKNLVGLYDNGDWRIKKYPYGNGGASVPCLQRDIARVKDDGRYGPLYTVAASASLAQVLDMLAQDGTNYWGMQTSDGAKWCDLVEQAFKWSIQKAEFAFQPGAGPIHYSDAASLFVRYANQPMASAAVKNWVAANALKVHEVRDPYVALVAGGITGTTPQPQPGFPPDVADDLWSAAEVRDPKESGGTAGRRKLTLGAIKVPAGYQLHWYSGSTAGGNPSQTRDVTGAVGASVLTDSALAVGETCHNCLYWVRTADKEVAKAAKDKAPFTILGDEESPPPDDDVYATVTNSADLMKALIAAPGGAVIELAPGTYSQLTRTTALSKSPAVTIRAQKPDNRPVFHDNAIEFSNVDGIIFDGLRFVGTKTELGGYPVVNSRGVEISHFERITFRNCTFDFYGIQLDLRNGKDAVVTRCHFTRCAQDNFRIYQPVKGLTISHNLFDKPAINTARQKEDGRHPDCIQFAVNGSSIGSQDVVIENNKFLFTANTGKPIFVQNERGPSVSQLSSFGHKTFMIRGNYMETGRTHAIYVKGCINATVTGNVVRPATSNPHEDPKITIDGNHSGLVIRDNVMPTSSLRGTAPSGSVIANNVHSTTAWPPGWKMPEAGPYSD